MAVYDVKECHKQAFWGINEKEIYNINYENISNLHSTLPTDNKLKQPALKETPEGNTAFSLEIEVSNSLEHLLTSPEKHTLSVLDVTVIRPSNLNFKHNSKENPNIYVNTELGELITSMEKQKQHKKQLIEEFKRNLEKRTLDGAKEQENTLASENLKKEEKYKSKRHRTRTMHLEKLKQPKQQMEVLSVPTKINYGLKIKHSIDHIKKQQQPCTSSTPISILKPLVGEIKQSLKHLEERIVEVGDHQTIRLKKKNDQYFLQNVSSDDFCNNDNKFKRKRTEKYILQTNEADSQNTQQVYATAKTFNKLKTLLTCQNPERREDEEKPCLCQHCGMVGLLMDSQKRPIFCSQPLKVSNSDLLPDENSKENDSPNCSVAESSSKDDNYYLIRNLFHRLRSLENRLAAHEQRSVSKDYFKRVIRRILHIQKSNSQQSIEISNAQDVESQCSSRSTHLNKIVKSKHRNVQIQQGCGGCYLINPLYLKSDYHIPLSQSETREIITKPKVTLRTKQTSVTEDFLGNVKADKDLTGKTSKREPKDKLKEEKSKHSDKFWRWGDEVIKPGIDLKVKIISLLNEQIKYLKGVPFLNPHPKSSEESCNLSQKLHKTKGFKKSITQMFQISKRNTVEESISSKDSEKSSFQRQPSRRVNNKLLTTFNKKLYGKKEKIESPTIEQSNNEELHDYTIIKEVQANVNINQNLSKTQDEHISENSFSNVVEKLTLIKTPTYKTAKLFPRSGIPIRINDKSIPASKSTVRSNKLFKSVIPKARKTPENYSNENNSLYEITHLKNYNKQFQKLVEDNKKLRKLTKNDVSSLKVSYINPSAEKWNEDSSTSFVADQVLVSDKLEFLKSLEESEIGKRQLWNNIWDQAKNYCRSKQDTIIVQIPTQMECKQIGITEVEFTIEDIQLLVDDPEVMKSINKVPSEVKNTDSIESFLLIRDKNL